MITNFGQTYVVGLPSVNAMMSDIPHPLFRHACILLSLALLAACREPSSTIAAQQARYDIIVSGILHDARSNKLYLWSDNIGIANLAGNTQQWTTLNKGLKSTRVTTLLASPHDPALLYAGSLGTGIYRSHDGGKNWSSILEGLTNSSVVSIAFDPSAKDTMYISTLYGGVFKSTDGGDHWNDYSNGLKNLDISPASMLALTPGTPSTLLLANAEGLYRKHEQDSAWSLIEPFAGKPVSAIEYAQKNRTIYVVAGYDGSMYKSTDQGKQWTPLTKPLPQRITALRVRPDSAEIYAGLLSEGIMKSSDQGNTWTPINKGLPAHTEVSSIALDARQPQRIYAGFKGRGVYVSHDDGRNWTSLNQGFPVKSDVDFSFLSQSTPAKSANQNIPVPKEFRACNVCHGWADPKLNAMPGRMLVLGTPRDWTYTVHRMNAQYKYVGEPLRDSLRPWEEPIVIAFLAKYYGTR